MKRLLCFAWIAAFALQTHASTFTLGNDTSSERYFVIIKANTDRGLNPVKGFLDEGIYSSMLSFCDKPTLYLGPSSEPVAFAGDGIGAIWSSADHHCAILYCDPIWGKNDRLVDQVNYDLSANVSCRDTSAVEINPADYIILAEALKQTKETPGDSICLYWLPDPGCMRLALDGWRYLPETRFPHAHCLGLLVTKPSNYPLRFKLLLSDKGFRQKDKYIKRILKSIEFE